MIILKTIAQLRKWRASVPSSKMIGFVPTMGALHEGHMSLIQRSVKENDLTIASIFVNPKQFGPKEDFSRYPKTWEKDKKMLIKYKNNALFAPSASEMYPESFSSQVEVWGLTEVLCGSPLSRGPGHFKGVTTVVSKLFNLVQPHKAYFGMKDFQQLRVIEKMVKDLNFQVKIIRCQTVRESDGLALSSRNTYLSPKERQNAIGIRQALQWGAQQLKTVSSSRGTVSRDGGLKTVTKNIEKLLLSLVPDANIDYIQVIDPTSLKAFGSKKGPCVIAAAVWIGKTRLIDNIWVS
ncbi:MAG: pantoate--beta-alanine ligase [Elusimicrobiota bacterium]